MQYQKYINALAMMDGVIAHSDLMYAEDYHKFSDKIKDADKDRLHMLWDNLYEYVFANFKEPVSKGSGKFCANTSEKPQGEEVEEELASMDEMFSYNREEMEAKLYEIPPTILEQCFPVWMARYMLCWNHRNVPVNPIRLKTFQKFHVLYGYMVINAGMRRYK